jgi:hypothetical protein
VISLRIDIKSAFNEFEGHGYEGLLVALSHCQESLWVLGDEVLDSDCYLGQVLEAVTSVWVAAISDYDVEQLFEDGPHLRTHIALMTVIEHQGYAVQAVLNGV